ncbi:MAG: branched-chain amino acid ABC transporter permease [Deltaproteobacteria bacterium]|nr:branched-chain amino acid ABC transporter permease [Deltaproteobacteria bacterium]MBW2044345.1 branched-chain amino acid ABC transporter permease [Deltaproteobacteria bacterium]MBW2301270.1 branched-chain amino acid ABC transporter permease [Deltaproteobacteria bacterium]
MVATTLESSGRLQKKNIIRFAPILIIGIILFILPSFIPHYLVGLFTLTFIFAIFAMSLDIVLGYTGLLSIMHASFFGIAAYTAAVLMVKMGINSFWVGFPCGILIAGILAAIAGVVLLRVHGIYFLIASLCLGYMVYSITWGWDYLEMYQSKGIMGIDFPGIGIPGFTFTEVSYCRFSFLLFLLCFYLLYRFVNSPFGYSLRGIREDEERMQVLGYNTWFYKFAVFIIGALFAGVAGVLFAYCNTTVEPEHLGFSYSTYAILMVILGGSGTLFGPPIGAALLVFLEFYTGIVSPERWPLILGLILILTIMFSRGGIGLHLQRLWKKVLPS